MTGPVHPRPRAPSDRILSKEGLDPPRDDSISSGPPGAARRAILHNSRVQISNIPAEPAAIPVAAPSLRPVWILPRSRPRGTRRPVRRSSCLRGGTGPRQSHPTRRRSTCRPPPRLPRPTLPCCSPASRPPPSGPRSGRPSPCGGRERGVLGRTRRVTARGREGGITPCTRPALGVEGGRGTGAA